MGISKKYILGLLGPDAPQGRVMLKAATAVAAAALLASCATAPSKPTKRSKEYFSEKEYGVKASPRVVEYGQPVPQGGGRYMVGKAYTVKGRVYKPFENKRYTAVGYASWYGSAFHGRYTANGEVYDMDGFSAAHPTMPLPSYARVTNLANGKSVVVRVNDRGPYHGNRLIDVSNTAAKLLEFRENGVGRVRVEYVGRAPLEGSDDRQLMATLRTGEPAPAPSTVRIASARAFIPDMTPSPSRGVTRGDVPLPAGRPYTLGNTQEDLAAAGASEVSASRAVRPGGRRFQRSAPAEVEEVAEEAPATTRPVAAYAPASRDNSLNLMSGRGLY